MEKSARERRRNREESLHRRLLGSGCAGRAQVAAYRGGSLEALSQLGCRGFGQPLTFYADAGQTTYLQLGGIFGGRGTVQLNVDVAAQPIANFGYYPVSGQTRSISVGVANSRHDETVDVQLMKSTPQGWTQVGWSRQSVAARGPSRPTTFSFNYTFTGGDASIGKVSFRAVATIIGARDALPTDNDVTALPTKVAR